MRMTNHNKAGLSLFLLLLFNVSVLAAEKAKINPGSVNLTVGQVQKLTLTGKDFSTAQKAVVYKGRNIIAAFTPKLTCKPPTTCDVEIKLSGAVDPGLYIVMLQTNRGLPVATAALKVAKVSGGTKLATKPVVNPVVPKTIKTGTLKFTGDGPTQAEIAAKKKAEAKKAAEAKAAADAKAKAAALAKQKAATATKETQAKQTKEQASQKPTITKPTVTAKPAAPIKDTAKQKAAATAKAKAAADAKAKATAKKPAIPTPKPIVKANQPPVVTKIEVPKDIKPGQKFTATITTTDDEGILALAVIYNKKKQPSIKAPKSKMKVASFDVELVAPKSGEIKIQTVALDSKGSKSAVKEITVTLPEQVAVTTPTTKSTAKQETKPVVKPAVMSEAKVKAATKQKAEEAKQTAAKKPEAEAKPEQKPTKDATAEKTAKETSKETLVAKQEAKPKETLAAKKPVAKPEAKPSKDLRESLKLPADKKISAPGDKLQLSTEKDSGKQAADIDKPAGSTTAGTTASSSSSGSSTPISLCTTSPGSTQRPTITGHDGTFTIGGSVNVAWSSVSGAGEYEYWMHNSLGSPQGSVFTSTQNTEVDIGWNQTYWNTNTTNLYFKVRARYADCYGPFTDIVTIQAASNRPQLVFPELGGNISGPDVEFRWQGIANADGYLVCIKNNASDAGCLVQSFPAVPGSAAGAGQETGWSLGNYYSVVEGTQKLWTVKAYRADGTFEESTARFVGFTPSATEEVETEIETVPLMTSMTVETTSSSAFNANTLLANQVATNMKNAGKSAEEIANTLKNDYNLDSKVTLQSLLSVDFIAKTALKATKKVHDAMNPQFAADVFHAVKVGSQEAASALMDAFKQTSKDWVMEKLNDAGYSTEDLTYTLKDVFGVSEFLAVATLKQLGIKATSIVEAIANVFGSDPPFIVVLLKDAGFSAIDAVIAIGEHTGASISTAGGWLIDAGYEVLPTVNALITELSATAEDIVAFLKDIQYSIVQIAGVLKDYFNLAGSTALGHLLDAGFQFADAAGAIVTKFGTTGSQMAEWLQDKGIPATDAGEWLYDTFNVTGKKLTEWMKDAGYSAADVAEWLHDKLNKSGKKVTEWMKAAGYSAGSIASVVKTEFSASVKTVAGWLKDANFSITTITNVVKNTFSKSASATIQILFDIGFGLGAVKNAVANAFNMGMTEVLQIVASLGL